MYPRRDEATGRYGYWRRDGWAVRPQFAYAHHFCSGYGAVELEDRRYGLIGRDGSIVPLDAICGARMTADDESSFGGFVDLDDEPSPYAAVRTVDGGRRAWGLIDTNLAYTRLPDEVFSAASDVRPYGEYVAVIRDGDRVGDSICGLFNLREMRLELPVEYAWLYPSRDSIWVVSRAVGDHQRRLAFYDVRKREFLPGWFWEALPFSCGLGAYCDQEIGGEGWRFVDDELRPAFDATFDNVSRFSHGLAAVYKDEDAGYIDTTGRMRLLLPYDDLGRFNEFGLAIANRDRLDWDIDIIDRTGKPRLTGLETAEFWPGDFPCFQVSRGGDDHFHDMQLNLIF